MIARNEEAHLRRCLASVRGLVDDIVVVDTGSTDATVGIARELGARIFTFAWRDDFSLARNFALEQVTSDWILSLDADEAIAARDHASIRASLSAAEVDGAPDGVIVPQRHYLTSGAVVGWQPGPGGYDEGLPYPGFCDVDCLRLFRNRPRLRFRNRLHETVVSTDPTHPLSTTRGEWVIHHFGKAGAPAVLEEKNTAYLRIGLKKIDDQPDDPQAHYELGILYAEMAQPNRALPCFERAATLSPRFRDTPLRLALCHARLGQHRQALVSLREADRILPQLGAEIALEEGNVHVALDDDTAAERAYRRALRLNPQLTVVHVNLAQLHHRHQRVDAALGCLDRALASNPKQPEALVMRARILTRQRRFEEASDCLSRLGESTDPEVAALRGAAALGRGDLAEAVTELRCSVSANPSVEAAWNLSTALEASGDPAGAFQAAAETLRLSPPEPAALVRFRQLAGDRFRERAHPDADSLTIFFYQPTSIAFDARTPRTHGLGGTESALVYLAEALTRLGHRVVVFNNCDAPGCFDGVEYARWEGLAARSVRERPDALIGVRFWQLIGQARLAPLQILWSLDAFDQPFLEQLGDARLRSEIDFVVLHSDWQAETFEAHHHIPASRLVRSRLGVAASTTAAPRRPADADARGHRLAYASTPFRGLDILLDLFPRIRAACPDAELDVFSSMQVYGVSADADRARFRALYEKAQQPGVNLVGTIPQLELAERLRQARILAYPNTFPETFCVAAIEAQAAGCAVVTSRLGALPETVGDGGFCLSGDPHSASYQREFIDTCVALLTDDERWRALSARAMARVWTHYTWTGVADEWQTLLRVALAPEPPAVQRIAHHLAAGRTGLAQRMLRAERNAATRPETAWDALAGFIAWRAGEAQVPEADTLRHLARHFPSIRRTGLIESAPIQSLAPAPPSAGTPA
jgi:glycosyltransferase involved in cell wall biosynthesis/Flp pilus assembly protein TadD